MPRCEWITNLAEMADQYPPPFDDTVLPEFHPQASGLLYTGGEQVDESATINLCSLAGHFHGSYDAPTWGGLVRRPKRASAMRELARRPEYYLSGEQKSGMDFIDVDGALYVRFGMHRTVIVRYLAYFNPTHFPCGPRISGVGLTRYEIDYKLMNKVEQLRQLIAHSRSLSHLQLERDGPVYPGRQATFVLTNPFVPERGRLTCHQDQIGQLFELLSSSTLSSRRFGSRDETYLAKPVRDIFQSLLLRLATNDN